MIDLTGIDSADVFTVWQRDDGSTGGVAYAPGFTSTSTPSIMQITCQSVPTGRPFIVMLRADVPFDYEENPGFTPDWGNPDGYGGCSA